MLAFMIVVSVISSFAAEYLFLEWRPQPVSWTPDERAIQGSFTGAML